MSTTSHTSPESAEPRPVDDAAIDSPADEHTKDHDPVAGSDPVVEGGPVTGHPADEDHTDTVPAGKAPGSDADEDVAVGTAHLPDEPRGEPAEETGPEPTTVGAVTEVPDASDDGASTTYQAGGPDDETAVAGPDAAEGALLAGPDSTAHRDTGRAGAEPTSSGVPGTRDDAAGSGALWPAARTEEYQRRWHEAQVSFVDDPTTAVAAGRSLLTDAVRELGDAVEAIGADADTEQLRLTMRRYHEALDKLTAL
ncbi:MAG: hypothetical protein WCA46_30165 [Actinocatenispora sp.]